MSKAIAIMGDSGSGKTTSMRNLDAKSTYYIDCDAKGLSWKGWKNQYNEDNKNYSKTKRSETVNSLITGISEKMPNIKVIVIDTMNAIMNENERLARNEKGYDKWRENAWSIWDILENMLMLRDDLTIICTFHTQTETDDSGNQYIRIKTNGRKLEKLVPESKFTTVLLSKRNTEGEYVFETQSKNSTAKSPMGAFESEIIPNDITEVIKALEEF